MSEHPGTASEYDPREPFASFAAGTEVAGRALAVLAVAAIALIHVAAAPDAEQAASYLFWLYMALVAIAVPLIVVLLHWRSPLVWAATATYAALPLIGYLWSRSIGLPHDTDDLGDWLNTLGLASMFVETSLLSVGLVRFHLLTRGPLRLAAIPTSLSRLVRPRILLLPLVALIGGLVGALPALTAGDTLPTSASFTAVDIAFEAGGTSATSVTIATGGTVSFSYPAGHTMHNVDFGTGPQPSSCELNGTPQAPPIPSRPGRPGWSATCTFNSPGTYNFHCDMHASMTGTVIVSDGTTTTTGTTSSTTTTTTTGTTTGTSTGTTTTTATGTPTDIGTTTGPASGPPVTSTSQFPTTPSTIPPVGSGKPGSTTGFPLAGKPSQAITILDRERRGGLAGSIDVSSFGRGGGAVITIRIRVGARTVQVGRLRVAHLRTGRVRFSVALNRVATRLLRQHGRLELTATITVAVPGVSSITVHRHLRLRQ